ncbi:MAG TPA: flagellar biosynthetic protein FliO [Terracidiphilus sp.]|nr:flagellar biosynthetic protein FliO [Terracidiphilus sp.]
MGALEATGLPALHAGNQGREPWSLAGWLLELWQNRGLTGRAGAARPAPRLALVERITLAPRQQLALVEAEGRHLLVAISPEGGPVFYALDGEGQGEGQGAGGTRAGAGAGAGAGVRRRKQARASMGSSRRISW